MFDGITNAAEHSALIKLRRAEDSTDASIPCKAVPQTPSAATTMAALNGGIRPL